MRRLFNAFALLIAVGGLASTSALAQTKEVKGTIRADVFRGITSANSVASVTGDPRYPNNPSETFFIKFLEYPFGADDGSPPPGNVEDNYGARIWGFLTPAATADYVFFVASDDPSEVWLSTDDKEANKKLIAMEPQWNTVRAWVATSRRPGCPDNGGTKCENRSDPINLQAGKKYFIEAIFREGLGGDNLAVTWIKKGDPDPEAGATPITGDVLSAVVDTVLKITSEPVATTRDAGQTAKFSVGNNSLGPDPVTYQWKKNGANIAGATSKDLTTAALTVADNGAKFSVTVTGGGQTVTSKEAVLTVLAVGAPINTPGFAKLDVYNQITGNPVQNLLDDPKYPNSPDETFFVPSLDSRQALPTDGLEAYGGRLSGLLTVPETGQYEFFIRSDDASQLFLSTDDKEAGATQIAEETGCCGAFEETGATETSAPIALTAGKRYYIQALWKEGTGGDFCQVAIRKVGDATAAATLQPIPASYLSSMVPSKGSVTITKQPVSVSVSENESVKFSVDATASHTPMVITWTKNGIPLAATGKDITVGPVKISDNGAKVKAIAAVPGAVAESAEVTITVTQDKTPPAIAKVTGSDSFTKVTVVFSEAVAAAGATTAANYTIAGLTVSAAKQTKPDTIVLTTAKQAENTSYTLAVKGLTDTASPANPIAANASKAFSSFKFQTGVAKWESFKGIAGNSISNLTDADAYKNETPSEVRIVPRLEGPTSYDEAYGSKITAVVIPATTGKYQFFLSTDDGGELWLSSDDNPANRALIATEPTWNGERQWVTADRRPGCPDACENRSALISLQAGKRYYIEVFQKEGGGGDNSAATWRLESEPLPGAGSPALGGAFIGWYTDPTAAKPPAIVTPPQGQTLAFGATATLTVTASGDDPLAYQWQLDGAEIKGATSATLSVSNFSADNIGRYRVVVKNGAGSATSEPALLMVPLTAQTGALFIEAEDFDFDNGKYVTDQGIGMTGSYAGGAYKDKGGTRGVDWFDSATNDQPVYRKATGVEAGKGTSDGSNTDGITRAGFDVKVNHVVGWNDAGDWYNYTRQTPAGDYYVIGRLSSGEPNNPIKAQLDEVTAGRGTANQTLKKLGSWNVNTTGGWDTFTYVALRDDAGKAAKVTLGGEKTLRFTTGPTGPVNLDINYLLFIPAGPVAPAGPKLTAGKDGANIKIEWAGTAALESADSVAGPWTAVAGAKSPFSAPTTGSGKFYRLKQ